MNCPEFRDHYELFALGLADEPERSEIRAHLNRGCEVCTAEMRKAMELTAFVGATAAPAAPSPKLRRRILASAGYEQRQFGWTIFAAATAVLACFAAVYFSGRENQYALESAGLREQIRRQTIDLTRLNEAFAILSGPDTTVTSFGAGRTAPPKGKVFLNARQGVLLIASNLPPAPNGKIYEMWVIPKSGKPAPAGLFQSQSDGTAMHIEHGPVDMAATGAVAVTLENQGGAPQPTSTPLIVAPLER
ncbi:MAG TPA: anti-sigma factor [Bryobacteraceae bacterium]|nr:anti-sigma factor [Bryobacteraceae bacterium]